jgi:hypothetical protein
LAGNCASIDAGAAAVTPFAIKATNVTMPSVTAAKVSVGVTFINLGSSEITVTGIPDDGILTIKCWYSGPSAKAKIPKQCGPSGLPGKPVTAGQTFYGDVAFVPYDRSYVPGISELRRAPAASGDPAATVLALTGALMLGFGFRRKTLRWFVLTVFAVSALAQLPQLEGQVFCFQRWYAEVFTTSLQIRCVQGVAGRGVAARLPDVRWGG